MEKDPIIFLKEGTQQRISIGLKGVKDKPLHNLDYVQRDISIHGHGKDIIKGQIVYGFIEIGHDEWDVRFKTMGFGVKFNDGSGTTSIDSKWELISKEEYEKKED